MRTLRLGLLCLFIAASAFAQQGADGPPDAIFYNGKIITVDPGFTIRQAFAVRNDVYVAVGTNASIRALASRSTRLVDLKGAAVIPGLSDNHDHLYNAEKVMRGIDLVGVTSTEEVLRRLRDGLAKAKPGETVFGSVGWRAPLTIKDLDRLSTDVPIVALRGRRGAALFNSAALKKAGIAKEMQSYMGKAVPKDASGELTGELPEWPVGFYAVDKVVPLPTPEEEDQMIVHGQKQRNALGITSIRDLSNWPPGMRAFVRMWQQGRLTVRVSMGIDLPDLNDPLALLRQQGAVPGFGDHWLRLDSAGEDPWNVPQKEYQSAVLEINRLGWRHSPHVPNNELLENVLQAYEAADRERPIRDKRWVVEHVPTVTPPLMDRLAKLGVIVSTNMAGYAGNYDAAVRALGQEQAERQTPVREMLDHHLVVVTGSDYNGPNPDTASSNNPFIPLYYYVSRKSRDGRVLGPQEKISRQEALRIATNNNAFATWEEKVKGSIEPGKLADFVVLSADFMTVPEDEILKLHPLATYVGGRQVYRRPPLDVPLLEPKALRERKRTRNIRSRTGDETRSSEETVMKSFSLNSTWLLAVAGAAVVAMSAAQPLQAELLEKTKNVGGATVHYKIVLPNGFDPATAYPGILALGGGPQTMNTVDSVLTRNFRAEAEKRGYIVIAPAAPDGQLFFKEGARVVPEFLKTILADYKIQDNKLHIAGPSNGGIASFHIAAANPQYFLSVTAFPGYMWEPSTAKLQAISKMCVFMYVGELDEYMWHGEMKKEADFLRASGTVARYTVEKGQPHRLETLAGANAGRLFDGFEETKKGCSK